MSVLKLLKINGQQFYYCENENQCYVSNNNILRPVNTVEILRGAKWVYQDL
jgi:hypothetical protein